MTRSKTLLASKRKKNDEFYTLYQDIADEVPYYRDQLRGKRILCPCDWDESFDEIFVYKAEAPRKTDLFGEGVVRDIDLSRSGGKNIERELGRMGVQTRRSLTVGSFLKDAIIPKAFRPPETHLQRAERMAKPYLMRDIGGDALECVSDVVFADEKGKDGIIHISPFTCMPEIMSQNIFPTMREEHEIPILTLIMDEQTGKAGYITRLEAFVDLMRRKKRAKLGKLKTRI